MYYWVKDGDHRVRRLSGTTSSILAHVVRYMSFQWRQAHGERKSGSKRMYIVVDLRRANEKVQRINEL